MRRANPLSDPGAVRALAARITVLADRLPAPVTVMEVCGSHTHAIAVAGLRALLPDRVRLISGPGCPVCVTPVAYLDRAEALALRPDTTVCTFGDLLRVPSSGGSLERVRAAGGSVEVVYSARDAVALAARRPERQVVFLGVGFETTAPTVAAALAEAEATGLHNFLVLSGHKVMPPPLRLLAGDADLEVQGLLCPGHVSVITGRRAFSFLAEEFGLPAVIAGFSPTDVLRGVLELVQQRLDGRAEVVNQYGRVVTETGNAAAHALMNRFFSPADAEWRGLGVIPGSGLALRERWAGRDAERLEIAGLPEPHEPEGCRCGDVLAGRIQPPACPLFGRACVPGTPVGACMVSGEGSCAAWYRHERSIAAGEESL